jgi:hypothetical protein
MHQNQCRTGSGMSEADSEIVNLSPPKCWARNRLRGFSIKISHCFWTKTTSVPDRRVY